MLPRSFDHTNAAPNIPNLEYKPRPSSLALDGDEGVNKEQDELDTYVDRLLLTSGVDERDLTEAAVTMNTDRQTYCTGISSMHQEMLVASKMSDNPFHHSKFPFDINTSFYADALKFVRTHLPKTYIQVLELRDTGHQFEAKDVIPTVQLISQLMNMTSSVNTSLTAMRSVFLKSSGLTNNGLDAIQRSGFSQTSR